MTTARSPAQKASLPTPLTLANSKHLNIGIIRGSALIPTMKELEFTSLYEVNTAEQMAQMLNMGRIDAMAESKWVDNYIWNKMGLNENDLIKGANIGETKFIYLGAAVNFPADITDQIQKAMIKVQESGDLDMILNTWTQY